MSANDDVTHVAFADESNWNKGRFRSIALVSSGVEDGREFHRQLGGLRDSLKTREFKWERPRRRYGLDLVEFFFQRCGHMRVDVLTWDMEDPRHKDVRGRDDRANFARMYYHLLHNVLRRRWPDSARWLICPDEHKGVDWTILEQCLDWKSWASEHSLFTHARLVPDWRQLYNVREFRPVCSREYPLVQLADLFAGLGAYSYTAFDRYLRWREEQDLTPSLLSGHGAGTEEDHLSNTDKERLPILKQVWEEATKRRFQVSLESTKGLHSNAPKHPLNFWFYAPQRPEDKAPVKEQC